MYIPESISPEAITPGSSWIVFKMSVVPKNLGNPEILAPSRRSRPDITPSNCLLSRTEVTTDSSILSCRVLSRSSAYDRIAAAAAAIKTAIILMNLLCISLL